MRKIIRMFIKATSWALSGLLGAIGLGSCQDNSVQEMYGIPWASYSLKGVVVNKATQKAVKDIEVKIAAPDSLGIAEPASWKAITNADGEVTFPDPPLFAFPLIVTDIDGESNGSYRTDTVVIDYKELLNASGYGSAIPSETVATVRIGIGIEGK